MAMAVMVYETDLRSLEERCRHAEMGAKLAQAQARDAVRQFNEALVRIEILEARIKVYQECLQLMHCVACGGDPVGRLVARAAELQAGAEAQAEHFLQERIALEDALDRVVAGMTALEERIAGSLEKAS